jgi:hypothetical protein
MNRQQSNDFIFQNTRRELSDNWDEKNKEHKYRYIFDQKEVCFQLFINTVDSVLKNLLINYMKNGIK